LAETSAGDRAIYFWCGALLGALAGFILGMSMHSGAEVGSWDHMLLPAAIGIAAALVCGLLSRRYGEQFWETISEVFRQGPGT